MEGFSEDIQIFLNTVYSIVEDLTRFRSDSDWSLWTKPYDDVSFLKFSFTGNRPSFSPPHLVLSPSLFGIHEEGVYPVNSFVPEKAWTTLPCGGTS